MQKFNWSTVIGCLIIGIAIIIAGQGIVSVINNKYMGGSVPGSFDIYNHDQTTYGDFLNDNEAAEYLRVSPETLYNWIVSGKLKGTYTSVEFVGTENQNIFNKAKLTEFMNNLINEGN